MDGAKEYRIGDSMKLQIKTDPQALVALGAVDTALYAVGGKTHKPLDMGKVCQGFSISSEPKLQSLRPLRPLSALPWSLDPGPFLSYLGLQFQLHMAQLSLSPALIPTAEWQAVPLSHSCLPASLPYRARSSK